MVVVRGVRMFSGLRNEEGGERPLREVRSICGLLLGCDDLLDDGQLFGGELRQPAKQVQRYALATIDGRRVHANELAIDRASAAQGLLAQQADRSGR